MSENDKVKLWEMSFWKPLFKTELAKIVNEADKNEIFELLRYSYDKYSDRYPDVLLEVFFEQKEINDTRNMDSVLI